jgi:ParB family transcriptional regulator, chromosome partitioning protein
MTKSKSEKRGLGRGLSALMADVNISTPTDETAALTPRAPDTHVPIEQLHPNPDQPRKDFTKSDLDDLAASIKEKGIIQPLLVRKMPAKPGNYQIVAGERRWRAAQMANLHEIPVLIRDLDDTEVIEIAIIENIQRADLNSVEEALGYRQLMDKFGHTQEKLAEVLGKSRSHIANQLRLLTLPEDVLELLRQGKLTAGHARALVTADNPSELARLIVTKGMSVRQTEKLAKSREDKPKKPKVINTEKDADTKALELDLSANLSMKVNIDHKPGTESGALSIRYTSLDQLDELCQILTINLPDGSK